MELRASSIYLKRELTVRRCVRDVGAPQTWRQRKTLLKRGRLRGWSSLDGGFRVVLPSPASSPLLTAHWHRSPLASSLSPSLHGSFMSPDWHHFTFPYGFMNPDHKYDNNKYERQDRPWSWLENDREGNFGKSNWKYPEKEQHGQC